MNEAADRPQRQRLDRWLYFARIVKSRTLATKLVQGGNVRVNREKTANASRQIGAGDVLTVTLPRRVLVLRVAAPGERRGPFAEAQLLYEDLTPPAEVTESRAPAPRPALREPGSGAPTKRERRAIERFTGVSKRK